MTIPVVSMKHFKKIGTPYLRRTWRIIGKTQQTECNPTQSPQELAGARSSLDSIDTDNKTSPLGAVTGHSSNPQHSADIGRLVAVWWPFGDGLITAQSGQTTVLGGRLVPRKKEQRRGTALISGKLLTTV